MPKPHDDASHARELELTDQIVELVRAPDYKPQKPRLIGERLRVASEEINLVKKIIKRLTRTGHLAYGANHLVLPPSVPLPERPAKPPRKPESGSKKAKPPSPPPADASPPANKVAKSSKLAKSAKPEPTEPIELAEPDRLEGDASRHPSRRLPRGKDPLERDPLERDARQADHDANRSPRGARTGAGDAAAETAGAAEKRSGEKGKGDKSDKRPQLFTGRFHRTGIGHGYVRPAGTQASLGRDADIYIPAEYCHDAATGDRVLVKFHPHRRGPRGKRGIGEITEIIERETHQFVGTYYEEAGLGLVRVDGRIFSHPVEVGDPGAKNAQAGDKVVFEMIRFPTHVSPGEGVLTEVLGKRGEPEVDTLLVIRQYGLPESFSESALEQARETARAFTEEVPEGRTDFTPWTTITIDPHDARDFDDAISLQPLDNGHWRLAVHIADVSHFVPAKSPLDREARDRATSVYLPTRVLPMLPETISNHVASLQPHRIRYTLTAVMEMTAEGARVATDVYRAAIRSDQRLTYEEVDAFLADPTSCEGVWPAEVIQLLHQMHTLAMILRTRRMERGAIELTLPEIKLDFDDQQRVHGAHRVENTVSHQIIEEFMLSANEAIAERLHDREIVFLRRIHESPDPRKLDSLSKFVREVGISTDGVTSRDEIKRILAEVDGKPAQYAINYAILRSMQKAVYSPEEAGHYALASACYCHFTSPIRRYPDLTVHRLLHDLLDQRPPHNHLESLIVLGEHCSDREQRAESAERDLIKLKLLQFLAQRIGQSMDAVITGVQDFGFFAQGLDFPAEGLVHVHSLAEDRYHYDSGAHTLTGYRSGNAFRLGDMVRVEIARVDVDSRELDLRFVKRLPHRPRQPLTPTGEPTAAPTAARSSKRKPPTSSSRSETGRKKRKKRS